MYVSDNEVNSNDFIDFQSEVLSHQEIETEDEVDDISEDMNNTQDRDPVLMEDLWIDDDACTTPLSPTSVNLQWTGLEDLLELSKKGENLKVTSITSVN